MLGLRQTIREAIIVKCGSDCQDNFKILEKSGENYKVEINWEAGVYEIIELKLSAIK
jgi:hypothetical protein